MQRLTLFGDTPRPFVVSPIALGSDRYGDSVSAKSAFAIMDAYFAAGGNVFDTAHIYAQKADGDISLSEKTVGEWIRANGVRDAIMLVTKGAHPDRHDMTKTRMTEAMVKEDLESSLETLGTDAVDVWFAHRDNPAAPAGEVVDMLMDATAGRVRHLGASNWTAARLAEANRHARKAGRPGFAISQIQWSLARATKDSLGDHTVVIMDEREEAWYAESRMPVMAYSPQAQGLFSKAIGQGADSLPESVATRYQLEENMDRIRRCRELSERKGVNPSGICLSYLTSAPFPVIPIIGCSRLEHVADSLRHADLALTRDERRFLAAGLPRAIA